MGGVSHPTNGAVIQSKMDELYIAFGFRYNESTRMFIALNDLPGTVRSARGSNLEENGKLGPLSLFKYDLAVSDVWEDISK